MKARIKEIVDNRWLIFALRLVLGGIFITASVGKLQYQAEFINTVISYGILPDRLAQFYGLMLPLAELFIGCSLVLGIFSRFTSALSIPLIISFIIASAYSLFHSLEDNCSCFGQLISLSHPVSLVLDAVMLLMARQLLLHKAREEFLSIGPLLYRLALDLGRRERFIFDKVSKFAIVVLAMAVVVFSIWGAQSLLNTESAGTPGSDDAGEQSLLYTELDSALASGKPAFLFFYCPVCPSGRGSQFEMIADLEREYGDRIVFIRINYKKDPQAAEKFDVEIDPTMLLITGKSDKGKYIVSQRFEGATDKEMLKDSFAQVLRNEPH